MFSSEIFSETEHVYVYSSALLMDISSLLTYILCSCPCILIGEPFLCTIALFVVILINCLATIQLDNHPIENLLGDEMMGRRRIRRGYAIPAQ